MIVILDYGLGNLGSIQNMLRRVDCEAIVSSLPEDIKRASKLILPGVGAFDQGVHNLEQSGLRPALEAAFHERATPLLGICLGMQLLTRRSQEGRREGLGWVDAETVKFETDLRLPHMGWNEVASSKPNELITRIEGDCRFYFLHTYHVVCARQQDVLAHSDYGGRFCAAFQVGPLTGVQFHPEKSHRFGMEFMRRWSAT